MTRPEDPATETTPLFDELALERLREGLARWGEDE